MYDGRAELSFEESMTALPKPRSAVILYHSVRDIYKFYRYLCRQARRTLSVPLKKLVKLFLDKLRDPPSKEYVKMRLIFLDKDDSLEAAMEAVRRDQRNKNDEDYEFEKKVVKTALARDALARFRLAKTAHKAKEQGGSRREMKNTLI